MKKTKSNKMIIFIHSIFCYIIVPFWTIRAILFLPMIFQPNLTFGFQFYYVLNFILKVTIFVGFLRKKNYGLTALHMNTFVWIFLNLLLFRDSLILNSIEFKIITIIKLVQSIVLGGGLSFIYLRMPWLLNINLRKCKNGSKFT